MSVAFSSEEGFLKKLATPNKDFLRFGTPSATTLITCSHDTPAYNRAASEMAGCHLDFQCQQPTGLTSFNLRICRMDCIMSLTRVYLTKSLDAQTLAKVRDVCK